MKGFGIYVKNDLLDPKHASQIGEAIWLYLWLLDKITSITEEGIGNTLNGKPIIDEDFVKEVGFSGKTYHRWLKKLKDSGYVNTKRSKNGNIITINKAVKIFKNKTSQEGTNMSPLNQKEEFKKGHLGPQEGSNVSKRNVSDSIITKQTKQIDKSSDETSQGIVKIFSIFEQINPGINYGNKTQRESALWLIKRFGLEKALGFARAAIAAHGKRYSPTITNPYALKNKLGDLSNFYRKEKLNQENRIVKI